MFNIRLTFKLSVKNTPLGEGTAPSKSYTNTPLKTTKAITFQTFQAVLLSTNPGALQILTSFSDPSMLKARQAHFSEMLEQLTRLVHSMTDTYFLEWLDMEKNLFVPLSPLVVNNRRRIVRSFMESSSLDQGIFSEETKKLKEILLLLAAGQDSLNILKEIEELFYLEENRRKFKPDEISRFMLGDTETKGFLKQSFSPSNNCHFMCGHYLNTLMRLTSKEYCLHADKFVRAICSLTVNKLRDLGVASHIETAGNRNCKLLAYQFLKLYKRENPCFEVGSLIKSPQVLEGYKAWLSRQTVDITIQQENTLAEASEQPSSQSIHVGIFNQSISEDEQTYKRKNFFQQAIEKLGSASAVDNQIISNISNHDMAVIKLTTDQNLAKKFEENYPTNEGELKKIIQSYFAEKYANDDFFQDQEENKLFVIGKHEVRVLDDCCQIKISGDKSYYLQMALGEPRALKEGQLELQLVKYPYNESTKSNPCSSSPSTRSQSLTSLQNIEEPLKLTSIDVSIVASFTKQSRVSSSSQLATQNATGIYLQLYIPSKAPTASASKQFIRELPKLSNLQTLFMQAISIMLCSA